MDKFFSNFTYPYTEIIKPLMTIIIQSIPQSLIMGTGILALLTQHYALGFLFLAMIESSIVIGLLSVFQMAVSGKTSSVPPSAFNGRVPSTYQLALLPSFLNQSSFPSGPTMFLGSIISYLLISIQSFSDEMNELSKNNSDWASRIPMAFGFGFTILFLFMIWRVKQGYEGFIGSLGSAILGGFLGFLIYMLHSMAGKSRENVNILGVPLLEDRSKFAVCTTK